MEPARDFTAPDVPPSASSGRGTNGHAADPPPGAAFKEAGGRVAELREYVSYYIAAKLDSLKLTARSVLLYAALGLVAAVVGLGALVTAVVLLLSGLAGAIGAMFSPDRPWAGALIVGFLVVGGTFIAVTMVMKSITGASRKRTVEKYESRKREERSQFGRNVEERAREQASQPSN